MSPRTGACYRFGAFRLDAETRLLYKDDQLVSITPKVAETLLLLVQNQGRLLAKEELLRQIWPDSFVEENNLTQNIWMLRKVLGQNSSGDTFIETIPKRGYRFVAEVLSESSTDSPPSSIVSTPVPAVPVAEAVRPSAGIKFRWTILILAAIAIAVTFLIAHTLPVGKPARRSVAVIQFKNLSGDAETEWLSTALSEMFTTELAAGSQLRLISSQAVTRMRAGIPLGNADQFAPDQFAKETLEQIRKSLGCDLIMFGSYLRMGGKIRVDMRLQDTASGETIDSLSQTDSEANLLSLVSASGAHLREKLGIGAPSPTQEQSIRAAAAANPEALRLYSEGLTRLRLFDAPAAEQLLTRAVAADPQYPLSHSALSAAWSSLGYDEKAKTEAKLAFDLSAKLSREDQLLVEGRYRQTSAEWTKAIEIYRALWNFYPDNVEYGLLLVNAQTYSGQGKQALEIIKALHALRSAATDPRIDIAEAQTDAALADYHHALDAARRATQISQAQGARLLEAGARFEEGKCLFHLTEPVKARESFESTREICSSVGDNGCVADALNNIDSVLRSQGNLDRAADMIQQALAIERRIGDHRGIARSLTSLANVLRSRADMAGAQALFEQALAVSEEIGDKRASAIALTNLGNVLNNSGHPEPAKKRYQEALDLSRQTGDRNQISIAMNNLAVLAYIEGDLSGAKKSLLEVLDLKRQIGDRSSYAYSLIHLGNVLQLQGDLEGARKAWKEQCDIQAAAGEKIVLAQCRLGLAELDMEEGRPESILAVAPKVAADFTTINPAADAWKLLAKAYLMRGDLKNAQDASDHAMSLAQKSPNAADYRIPTAITAARVAAACGRSSEAIRSLHESLSQATKLNLVGVQLDARLALCEIQKDQAQIAKLKQDAHAMGFGLIEASVSRLQVIPK